jgi:biopolymer transport protein ExbB
MLGFIGTISGIIKIFYNISLTDNISIGIISGGLIEKMISSGSGLIVGVIAFSGYHILNLRIMRLIAKVEEESFEFLNILRN